MKLAILTPMYGAGCMSNYCVSMVDLARKLTEASILFDFFTLSNDSLVQRARNILVHRARNDPSTTHILFVDADIGFHADDVLKMLTLDRDIVVGAYSRKSIEWDKVRRAIKEDKPDIENYAASTFVLGLEGIVDIATVRNQHLLEIKRAGTGFLLVKKSVFDLLEQSPHTIRYKNSMSILSDQHVKNGEKITAFFHCPIDLIEDDLISEDYYFFDSWRRIGGKLYLAPWIRLTHWGTHSFS